MECALLYVRSEFMSIPTTDPMNISPALFGDFPIFQDTSQKKRVGEPTSKLFSKKANKQVSKEDSPTLQRRIKELTTPT